jgi:type II secretory pathway component PulF
MATLFRAGVPLLSVIGSIKDQIENVKFKQVLEKMITDIQDGLSISDAMERHPTVFSELYVSMIRAGEAGGIMDEILARLADLLEKQEQNEAKVRAALRYPKVVIGLMVAAVFFLMWKVVPVFVQMFQTVKLELPLATRILIAANTIFLEYWYLPLVALLGFAGLFKKYTSTTAGRFQWDRLKLKLPLIGPIILRSSMTKFARVFGNLQRAGVPILDALQVSTRVVDNVVIADVITRLGDGVQEGLGLAPTLKQSGWVPAMVVQMVAVGEESGSLEEMLIKVADYYDQEVDRAVATLTAMIEPILIVFIGTLVLFLALAIYLPMWDLSQMANTKG